MREQPWHQRLATAQHHVWYANLLELHSLTTAWLHEIEASSSATHSHSLPRTVLENQSVSDTLWMLQSVAGGTPQTATRLDALMDDTHPEDVLGRLERTVWTVQALTVSHLLSKVAAPEQRALINQMEQISWKRGRDCAKARWAGVDPEITQDLRAVFAAFRTSPLGGRNPLNAFLIRRALSHEVQVEFLDSHHQSPYLEVRLVADLLSSLHAHWARGFAYALNTTVNIEHHLPQGDRPRCLQRWYFVRS